MSSLMVELDLDRVRQAWRDAPDVEVARALHNQDDYPPEEPQAE
jgi:hypothetical protein